MKKLVLQIYSNPKYSKAFEWGKLISVTGFAQILVQLISFICGILVIRLLPTQEYALYTLANAMLGTMILLADSGVSTGVMAQGARVWENEEKLGTVLVTGLDLRKKFAIGSLVIATPALLYLLRHHGASWLMSVLIIASLVPAFFTGLSGTLLEIVFKLRQNIIPLQKIQVMNNAGRLALLASTLLIFPWTFVALLAAGLPQIWANMRLRNLSADYVSWNQKPDNAVRKELLFLLSVLFRVRFIIVCPVKSPFGLFQYLAQVQRLRKWEPLVAWQWYSVFSACCSVRLYRPVLHGCPLIKSGC
jgi:hypothetical protein